MSSADDPLWPPGVSSSVSGHASKQRCAWLACLVSSHTKASGKEITFLRPHSETRVEGNKQFVAADSFKAGSRIGGRTLGAIGWTFTDHFSNVVEHDVPTGSIKSWTLLYAAGDDPLIKSLGGEGKAAVPYLSYIHQIMAKGENGPSHGDWQSNFAYVVSPLIRRLMAVNWHVSDANEWNIGAAYTPHAHLDWRFDSRVFGG